MGNGKVFLCAYFRRHKFLEWDMEMNKELSGMRGLYWQSCWSLLRPLLTPQFHLKPQATQNSGCTNAFTWRTKAAQTTFALQQWQKQICQALFVMQKALWGCASCTRLGWVSKERLRSLRPTDLKSLEGTCAAENTEEWLERKPLKSMSGEYLRYVFTTNMKA